MRPYKLVAMCVGLVALLLTAAQKSAGQSAPAELVGVRSYDLVFSTFFGGSGGERIRGMALDAEGNVVIVGDTNSRNFPTTPGALLRQAEHSAFAAKVSRAGKLIWSTLVANGTGLSTAKVDSAGNVIVAGNASEKGPTTPGVFQPTFQGASGSNGWVAKLKPDGSSIVWASFVGLGFYVRDMDIDQNGDIYLIMSVDAKSTGALPEEWFARAIQKKPHVSKAGYTFGDTGIMKVCSDGTRVIWATWIGGSKGNAYKACVAVDRDRCPVLYMGTDSADVPTTPGAFSRKPLAQRCGWLGKISADGSKVICGTYVPPTEGGMTHNVAIDRHGNIFAATSTAMWPVTPGAFQTKFGGGPQDFGIAKFSPTGALLAATYLGGSGHELNGPDQIVAAPDGNIMIAGASSSADYPVTKWAFQAHHGREAPNNPYTGVVSVLSNNLSTLIYSTYIGGSENDMARACCFGPDGTLYVGGATSSKDFPTRNAFQDTYAGNGKRAAGMAGGDCWVARLRPIPAAK